MQTIDTLFKSNLINDMLENKLELLDNFEPLQSFNDIIQRSWKEPGLKFKVPDVLSAPEANLKSILNSNPLVEHAKNIVQEFRDTSSKIQESGLPYRYEVPSGNQIQMSNSISMSETRPAFLNNDPAITSYGTVMTDVSNGITDSHTSIPSNDISDPVTGPISNPALPGKGVKPAKRIAAPPSHSSKRQNTGPSDPYRGDVENYNLNLNNQNDNARGGLNIIKGLIDLFG